MRIVRKHKNQTTKPARGYRRASTDTTFSGSLLALESRIMFDGAAVETAGAVTTEQLAQSQADATTADHAPAAPTGEPQPTTGDQSLLDALAVYDTSIARQEILFLSPSVRDYQQLLDGISPNVEVIILDPARDGVEQMAEALAGRTGIDAVHIISHGTQAGLALGTARLTLESMNGAYADELAAIGQSFSEQADFLIYGCDFGQGEQGAEAATRLGQLTGADVAASTDNTGHTSLGGDWELEHHTGQIETDIAVSAEFQAQWVGLLPTYTEFINYTAALEIKSDANHGQTLQYNSGSGTYTVNQVSLALHRESGTSAQTITVQVRDSWNGTVRGTATISSSSLTTSAAWYDLSFADVNLNDGQSYTIRVSSNTTDGKVHVGFNSSGGYSGGNRIDTNGSPLTGEDVAFKVGYTAPPNTPPAITNLSGDSLSYNENAGAVVIEQGGNATVSDVDSADFNSGTLTVSFTAGSDSTEDVLAIRNQGTGAGQIGVSGANVTYGGVTIGTVTGGSGGSNLVITLNVSATPTAVTALVKNITYENTDTSAPTTGARTVRYGLADGDGGTSANYDTTVTVSAVNDAPTITNLSGDSLAYSEGAGAVVLEQGGNALVSDVDSTDFNSGTLTVSFTAGSDSTEDVLAIRNQGTGAGQIGVSGANVTYGGVTIGTVTGGSGGSNLVITLNVSATPTAVTALVKNITYENTDTSAPTTGARTVRYGLTDGDGGTSANYDTTVTVSGVNDAPVNTVPGPQTVGEDGSLVFSAGNGNQISVSDIDAAGGVMQITLTATNGTLTLNGTTGLSFITGDGTADATMIFAGTVANINSALNGLGFTPTPDFTGAASIQIHSQDEGHTGSGGPQSDTDTVAITVTDVNDPPVISMPGPQGTLQNTTLVFSSGNGNRISVSDADAGSSAVQITLSATNGTFTLSGTTGLIFTIGDGTADAAMTFTGTIADVNQVLDGLGFTPDLNYNGPASVELTVDDQGNTGGGARSDTDTASIIVSNNISPVVTTSGGSLSYTENDGAVVIDTAATVADADNANLTTARVQISGNYVNGQDLLAFTDQLGITGSWNAAIGTLTLTGSATVADYQTALRSITYTNLSDAPSTATRTVSFVVNDGTVDSAIVTRTVTVSAVNDAPVNTVPGAQTVNEDTALPISGVSVDDVDGNLSTVQLAVGNGTVTVTLAGAATITAGANGSATLTLSGSQGDINATLASLNYQGTLNYSGPDTLTVTSTDSNAVTDVDTVALTVTAVNDAPVNTVPGAQTVAEDMALALSGLSVTDVDGNLSTVQLAVGNGTVTVTLAGAATITAGANGSATLTLSGSQGDINATLASLNYQGMLNFIGSDTLTVTSTDSNAVTDVDTVALTVTAVNSVPSLVTNAGSTVVQGLTDLITSGELQVADVDNQPAQLIYTVTTAPVNGRLELTTAPGVAITSFTQADINAGRLVFVHSGAPSTSDSFIFTVSDGAGGTIGATTFTLTVTPFAPPPPPPPPGPGPVPGPGPAPVAGPPGLPPVVVVPPLLPPSVLGQNGGDSAGASVVGATDDPARRAAMPSRPFARVEQPDIVLGEPLARLLEPLSNPVKTVLALGHKLAAHLTRLADNLERAIEEREQQARLVWRVASFSGIALSAGFVVWLLQGGSLLTSFLVSLPAWRHFDPLPVLGSAGKDRRALARQVRAEDEQENKKFRGLDRVLGKSAKPAKRQETDRARRPKP